MANAIDGMINILGIDRLIETNYQTFKTIDELIDQCMTFYKNKNIETGTDSICKYIVYHQWKLLIDLLKKNEPSKHDLTIIQIVKQLEKTAKSENIIDEILSLYNNRKE